MKKAYFTLGMAVCLFLSACAGRDGEGVRDIPSEEILPKELPMEESILESDADQSVRISQSGSRGTISIDLLKGWAYALCPEGSPQIGDFGIVFYPEDVEEGHVYLMFEDPFGVCGMGLESETVTLAGDEAEVGVYDGHAYWDFIAFHGVNKGVVALTNLVEDWWPEYGEQAMEILDTLVYEPGELAADSMVPADSRLSELGLSLEIRDVTPAGAMFAFVQSGGSPTGRLECGFDFVIEGLEDGEWKTVPIMLDRAAFQMSALLIPREGTMEKEVDWKWIYGELAPGEYRIGKSVMDFRGTGDYDKYMIYGYFTVE